MLNTYMSDDTYIYKGIEVKPTGRKASKKKKRSSEQIFLHEIKPVDEKIDFLEWVNLEDLFKVEE